MIHVILQHCSERKILVGGRPGRNFQKEERRKGGRTWKNEIGGVSEGT